MSNLSPLRESLLIFILVATYVLLSLPAIGQSLEDQAKKEGKIGLYTTMNATETARAISVFKKIYPSLDVNFFRAGDEALLTKIETEARLGQNLWDVVQTNGFSMYHLFVKGFLAKYESPERKFFSDGLKDKEGYWTSNYNNAHVLAYNTRMVSKHQAPRSYEDLIDPKWKGNMVLDAKDYEWFANMMKFMGEEKGMAYMKKLAAQELRMQAGHTLLTQLVAAGEAPLGIAMYSHRVEQMKRQGAPVEWVGLNPVVLNLQPVALAARAPHPNAGKLLLDFLLSKEMAKIIQGFNRIPARNDVPPDPPSLLKGVPILPSDLSLAKDFGGHVRLFRDTFKVR
ncbi:MAG: extracellular solute-binding protein [Deltaproteobacteria bacterium]|nr:extracellular solute-binding protein [Deltaproteobacteria bacterium]